MVEKLSIKIERNPLECGEASVKELRKRMRGEVAGGRSNKVKTRGRKESKK